jgi:CRP-like cAMP-binding protein
VTPAVEACADSFASLLQSKEAFRLSLKASRVLRVPPGHVVFRKGDAANCCYVVLDGAVKVTFSPPDGPEMLLAILGRGEVVGEMALLDGSPRSATVTTVKASELRCISADSFRRMALDDPDLRARLFRLMAARVRQSNEAVVSLHRPLRMRLARALVQLVESVGEQLPDGRFLIRQKLSQETLGRMIGAARENVNRQLAEWQRERLLSRISRYYCVSELAALERIARGDERA